MDIELDIPQYFICPISLQIMKDPVTTISGITYDHESIEKWVSMRGMGSDATAFCPITKLPLQADSDITPNHMLRRLIQAWCVTNAKNGIDRIPTPKSPVHKAQVLKLIREVNNTRNDTSASVNALKKMDELVKEGVKNRKCMEEAGVAEAMVLFILRCCEKSTSLPLGLEEALSILHFTWNSLNIEILEYNNLEKLFHSLLWIFKNCNFEKEYNVAVLTHTLAITKHAVELANSNLKERLKLDFFKQMVNVLRKKISERTTRAAIYILIQTCPYGRNKMKIVDVGAIYELVEIELLIPEKKTSELVFNLLAHLCSCADGRQQLLKHAGGIAVVAKRILRISTAIDDRALCVIDLIARFSATREVLSEMLRVGVVSKLCMVLQADCAVYLRKKAREILKLHSDAWSNSPCVQMYLFTRYPR